MCGTREPEKWKRRGEDWEKIGRIAALRVF
jgi:hypothetical protein